MYEDNKSLTSIIYSIVALILSFVLMVLIGAFLTLFVEIIMSNLGYTTEKIEQILNSTILSSVINALSLLGFLFTYIIISKITKLNTEKETKKFSFHNLLIVVIISVISFILLFGINANFQILLNNFSYKSSSFNISNYSEFLVGIITMCIFPAVLEELIFRGVVFKILRQKGVVFATVLSSLIFAIYHFNLSQLLFPIFMGMILCLIYEKTNDLRYSMIFHFTNNFISLCFTFFLKNFTIDFSIVFLVLSIFSFIALIGIICLVLKKFSTADISKNKIKSSKHIVYLDELGFYLAFIALIVIYIISISYGF